MSVDHFTPARITQLAARVFRHLCDHRGECIAVIVGGRSIVARSADTSFVRAIERRNPDVIAGYYVQTYGMTSDVTAELIAGDIEAVLNRA